jgi:hypothetical protein
MRSRLLLLPLAFAAAGLVVAPSKSPWAGYKPGSFVKSRTITVIKVGAQRIQTITEIAQTVIEVKPDHAVIETTAAMNGVPQATRTRSAASLTAPLPPPMGKRLSSGQENLAILGRTLHCDWIETETEMAGSRTTTRTWTAHEVPGGVVKSVQKNEGMESTLEVVAFAVK